MDITKDAAWGSLELQLNHVIRAIETKDVELLQQRLPVMQRLADHLLAETLRPLVQPNGE